MLIPLLANLGAAGVGGWVGLQEAKAKNMVELERIKQETERDKEVARQGQLKSFYEALDRKDDPKLNHYKRSFFWGLYAYETNVYKFASIPARYYRFIVMLLLASAYAFDIALCAVFADVPIQSFPAAPEQYKWLSFLGFTLVEGTKNNVYELTLGGLILPLFTPVTYAITRYVTGNNLAS